MSRPFDLAPKEVGSVILNAVPIPRKKTYIIQHERQVDLGCQPRPRPVPAFSNNSLFASPAFIR